MAFDVRAGLVSTRARIVLAVIALAIVPLVALAWISLAQQQSAAIADTYDELDGLAEAQVAHLESIVLAEAEVAEILAANRQVKSAVNLARAGGTVPEDVITMGLGNTVNASRSLVNISVYDWEGEHLVSYDETALARYEALDIDVTNGSVIGGVIEGRNGEPTMLLCAPIIDNGAPIGVVMVESDATVISDLTETYTSLSATGETSVAQPTPEGAQFIAPLRFKEGAVLNITVPSTAVNAPITLAMAGEEGRFGETVDYRNEEVLAVTRHMELTGWGIVVKIDKAEALAGVTDFRNTVLAALLFGVILVLLVTFLFGRVIWRPVSEITDTVLEVASGDLSRRASVESTGEIGVLARAVNSMTDDLVNAAMTSKARRVELELVNRKLAESEEELSSFWENAVDGMVVVDCDGVIHRMNQAGERLFDLDSDDAKGVHVSSLLSAEDVVPSRLFEVAARTSEGIDMIAVNYNGDQIPVHVAVSRIELHGEYWYTGAIRDMSERQRFRERLRHLAHHDDVTGLPNRSCLREVLEESLHAVQDTPEQVGILFLDLDQFKLVNDSRGHAAGDRFLKAVGERLQAALRGDEKVARFGGDEFVVLRPRTTSSVELEALARRVHAVFEVPIRIDGEIEHVSLSIGAAMSGGGIDPDALISNADVAMYEAKKAGRNRTVVFDAHMRGQVEARHQLEMSLRRAVESDEIFVQYQPIVELDTGKICGIESLARWNRAGHGPVSPADFIPIAEDSGLIVPLGRSVFRQVCEQSAAWRRTHPERKLRLTVNMSSRQLMQPDCVETVRRTLKETGADPESLLIEVTESALSADIELAARRLGEIRDLGIAIAVDDFGTGYSSLTYLRQFPLDIVKIDRSFMSELEDSAVESSIVSLVVGLGKSLGIKVVAEGVETEGQLRALRELGCDLGQGYLFAKPQTAEEVEGLLWPDFDATEIHLDAA